MYRVGDILKKILSEQEGRTIKLIDHYEGMYPDNDEMLWIYVEPDEFEEYHFEVIDVNPVEIFTTWKTTAGDMTIEDSFNYANNDQKEIVNYYRKNISKTVKELVVVADMEKILVDGYHRIAGMAMEGITKAKAIDLNS